MKRPELRIEAGKWVADLRALGFGRYRVCDASEPEKEALHCAYEMLADLRRERMAELSQRDLFDEKGPEFFGAVLDRWQAEKRYDRAGSEKYGRSYAKLVRAELGAYRIADFAQPDGNRRMVAYVRELEKRSFSGRTIRNRLSIAEQVLRFAVERGWLASAPLHPKLPPKAAPVFHWITEPMFRALRSDILRGVTVERMGGTGGIKDAAGLALYVARRRVYLSWLFYTGVHNADADTASADQLFLDGRAYIRHNQKSSRVVPDEQFEMPEPLFADLTALQEALGRPFFPGERFAGGPWSKCSKVMQAAARRLGFPHGATPRILRRSYAREMFLRGYEIHEVADRMGHVDERMLREIYVRTPKAAGHARSRWLISGDAGTSPAPSGMARVLQFAPAEV